MADAASAARRSTRASQQPLSLAEEQAASALSLLEQRDVAAALHLSLHEAGTATKRRAAPAATQQQTAAAATRKKRRKRLHQQRMKQSGRVSCTTSLFRSLAFATSTAAYRPTALHSSCCSVFYPAASCIKQYIPSKPHKWGYKIWCLSSDDYLLK
jgi:hypothetical protein